MVEMFFNYNLINYNKCRQIINKTCRCGRIEKEVPCSYELLCENKCNKMKQCKKHKCKKLMHKDCIS
jgi:hypothetical protein